MARKKKIMMMLQETETSLINWNRTLGEPNPTTLSNATSPRVMDTQHYYIGIQMSNYYYKNYVTSYSFSKGSISVTATASNTYGLGVPVEVVPGLTYKLSAINSETGFSGYGYYDADWNYISKSDFVRSFPATVTIPSNVKYAVIWFGSTTKGTEATFTDIKFEKV